MTAPTVTVLTAVRNGERFLTQTIESILAQTVGDWEYVVVDDASSDGTVELVERYRSLDPRIVLVRRDVAGGPYAAANTGLAVAKGRFVARIDADDVAMPNRLARQLSHMRARPDLEALTGAWRWIDARDVLGRVTMPHAHDAGVLRWSLCVLPGIVHSTAFVLRDALMALGGYPELPTSADLWLWCAFARRGTLGAIDDVLVAYRHHEGQITSSRSQVQQAGGAQVLRDHLHALTGDLWPMEDVVALRATGRWTHADFGRGSRTLDRWELAWRADPALDRAQRRTLRLLTARTRLRHMRVNATHPGHYVRGVSTLLWRDMRR